LNVGGITTLTGATISGSASITGGLNVSGTSRLQDASVLGSATVVGTLNVGGITTLTGATISGSASITGGLNVSGTSRLQDASVLGSATVGGTLNVGGITTLTGATISSGATITGGLNVSGTSRLQDASVLGSATVAGTLNVSGITTLTGATISGSASITGGLNVSGTSRLQNTSVLGSATIAGTLNVGSNTTMTGELNITSTDETAYTFGNYPTTTLVGALTVAGSATVGNLYCKKIASIYGDVSIVNYFSLINPVNGGSTRINFVEGLGAVSDTNYFGGFIQYNGSSNVFNLGTQNGTSTSAGSINIARATGIVTFPLGVTATGGLRVTTSATITGSLSVAGSVTATSYFATSDSRIKKNIVDISNSSLDILRKIQPRKYEHIDHEKQGGESIYGFIAQEVKRVLPAAVSTNPDFVPSIYENAFIDNKTITLINKSTNDILNGNIKLYDKNRNEIIVKKTNTITDKMFSIDAHIPDTQVSFVDEYGGVLEQRTYNGNTIFMKSDEEYRGMIRKSVFVYGHHVEDFHVLNKDTIWTILLSSTQELDKQVQANNIRLESVNKQQEDRISELEATVKRQQAEIDEIKEMLKDCVYR